MKQHHKLFLIRFSVEGSGDFPIDMLRYDGACPATESDSYLIAAGAHDRRRVRLQAWNHRADWRPTDGRWESFLWRVVEVER